MKDSSWMEKGTRVVAAKKLISLPDPPDVGLSIIQKGTGGVIQEKGRRKGYWIVCFDGCKPMEMNHNELEPPSLLDRVMNSVFGNPPSTP